MAFWNDKLLEPKRNFRWILKVDGIDFYYIKEVSRPNYEVSVSEHKFINHTFYFPGRVTYSTVSFKLVDAANPDAAETLRQMLFAGGYRLPTDERKASQSITKQGAVTALGDIQIMMLNGGGVANSGANNPSPTRSPSDNNPGDVVEFWTLHNAFITKIEFSQLSYENDDLSDITVEVRYDYAILNDPQGSPANGGRAVAQPNNKLRYDVARGRNPARQD
tara:strand:- start:89 stop:748 length:660 start_codon:yes stop_codon:yes gene_type:complete